QPGAALNFNLTGINDKNSPVKGTTRLKLLNNKGEITREKTIEVKLPTHIRKDFPVNIKLPDQSGGYLMVAEFTPENKSQPTISRRYIKIGQLKNYRFFDLKSPHQ
ncbi:MAG: hypothetical protein V5A59_06105, partial [Bacteroidales bacterium]